jgi:hypothetical protein
MNVMTPTADPIVLRGWSRHDGPPLETTVRLEAEGFVIAAGAGPPVFAAYRDLGTVAVESGSVRIELGDAPPDPWLFERFGQQLGRLASGLRDGRFRQWLTDGLLEEAAGQPIELLEATIDGTHGVAQVLYHDRGVALAPVDDRRPALRVRRADIAGVSNERGTGRLRIEPSAAASTAIELAGLGALEERHRQRWQELRDQAATEMAAIVGLYLADAPFDVRQRALEGLVEGRAATAVTLGPAFERLEAAVLREPDYARSYRALVDRAGGETAARWIALAPARPGAPDDPRVWFLVGLPGNLLALELVSAGAHATYLYRVAPRASFDGRGPHAAADLEAAVRDVSDALIDARFLREPMAIPADRLAEPDKLRYRLALAVLPSLARARERFVARLVHADPATWEAGLDDLIAWHGDARDEDAVWPGRAGQESAIDAMTVDTVTS